MHIYLLSEVTFAYILTTEKICYYIIILYLYQYALLQVMTNGKLALDWQNKKCKVDFGEKIPWNAAN
jgi:hypothetical protein